MCMIKFNYYLERHSWHYIIIINIIDNYIINLLLSLFSIYATIWNKLSNSFQKLFFDFREWFIDFKFKFWVYYLVYFKLFFYDRLYIVFVRY
jgi:hypothetical protein